MRDAAVQELEKVFSLCREGIHVEMFSPYIDAVWHSIADQDGRVWAIGKANSDIIHNEKPEAGSVTFVEAYEGRWGKLPDVWFFDEAGDLRQEMKSAYDQYGVIYASWNCTPGMSPTGIAPDIHDILDNGQSIARVPFDIPNVPKQELSIPPAVQKRIPNITPTKNI